MKHDFSITDNGQYGEWSNKIPSSLRDAYTECLTVIIFSSFKNSSKRNPLKLIVVYNSLSKYTEHISD